MDVANGLTFRLKQILSKLKLLNVVRSYTLKIDYGRIGEDLKDCLLEVNALLRKCVKKIRSKPRRAEIRKVIGELVRKKNTKRLREKLEITSEIKEGVSENEEEMCQKFEFGKRYLCEFCGCRFIHYSSLKVHILKVHESDVKPEKPIEILPTGDSLAEASTEGVGGGIDLRLLENSSQSSENQPTGVITKEVNARVSDLVQNENDRVATDSAESYICPQGGCARIFQKRGSLKKHIRLKHNAKTQYRCGKCEKAFFERGKLNRHMLTHQRGQFQCSKCRQTFHRMDNLKRHIALQHETVKSFECGFCKKKFSLKCNRDVHETNVHTNSGIQCESCGKQCKNQATLKVHKRLHEESRISCSLCCKTFTRKTQYRNHLKNKHKGFSPFQKLFDTFATASSNSPS